MNRYDEAVQFSKLEQADDWRMVLLVTSALHMPRSVALLNEPARWRSLAQQRSDVGN